MCKSYKPALNPTYFTIITIPHEKTSKIISSLTSDNKLVSFMNGNINNILTHSSSIANWKDQDLRFAGCTDSVSNLLGLKSPKHIIGRTDVDLPWGHDGYSEVFEQEDQEVLAGSIKFILGNYKFFNKDMTVLVKKIPLFGDNASKEIVGILNYLIEIPDNNLTLTIASLMKAGINITPELITSVKSILFKKKRGYLSLSDREEECLYYLLKDLSAKEIAKITKLSPRTIETYLDNIKNKFQCCSRVTLIIKATKLGYADSIPLNLIKLEN